MLCVVRGPGGLGRGEDRRRQKIGAMTQELLRVCVSSVCQHRSEKSSLNSNFQLFYRLQSTVHAGGKKRDTCTTDECWGDVFYTSFYEMENYCAVR